MNTRPQWFRALSISSLGLMVLLATAPLAAQPSSPPEDLFRGPERAEAAREVARLAPIQARHQDALLALPGVHGMGIGADPITGEMVFRLFVEPGGILPDLPTRLDGVRVVVERSELPVTMNGGGGCQPCHANQVPLPVPMGNSTGNPFACFSCTLGFKACRDGVIYYVTNAHCSQDANGCEGGAPLGSDTLHRGMLDASCTVTTDIGDVSGSATPVCGQNNTVDATRVLSSNGLTSWSIRDIGTPATTRGSVLPGDSVQKSGRTTGHTFGTVNSVNYSSTVSGYCCGLPQFVGQIRVDANVIPFIQGGDSGSALLDRGSPPKIVGLLFAGSNNGSFGIANPILDVLARLNLTLDPNCQPPTCEDFCYDQLSFCEEEYCYWNYDEYMCSVGCDEQFDECIASC